MLARGESLDAPQYDDELFRSDVKALSEGGEPAYCGDRTWVQDERVFKFIQEHRGLDADEQYKRGIVSMPTKIQSMFISHEMKKLFPTLLPGMDRFDAHGNFIHDQRKDVIAPLYSGRMVRGLGFYSLAEIKAWPKAEKKLQKSAPTG